MSQDDSFDAFPAAAVKRTYAQVMAQTTNSGPPPLPVNFEDDFPALTPGSPVASSTPIKKRKKTKRVKVGITETVLNREAKPAKRLRSNTRYPSKKEREAFSFDVDSDENDVKTQPSVFKKKAQNTKIKKVKTVVNDIVIEEKKTEEKKKKRPVVKNMAEEERRVYGEGNKKGVKRSGGSESNPAPKKKLKRRSLNTTPQVQALKKTVVVKYNPIVLKQKARPARLIGKRRRQRGGAGRVRKNEIQGFVKKNTFPTDEENTFFEKNVELSTAPRLRRQNTAFMAMDTVRMKFINLDEPKKRKVLHLHTANLLDIFIRRMIQKAGGKLKKTKYWLQLNHRGYVEKDGFFVAHKTHAAVDGGIIMTAVARHMMSNKEIQLDESFSVTMNIFKDKKMRLTGRGSVVRTPNKIRNVIMEECFGVKQNRVIGDTHCLPKALALGKLESDATRTVDPDEKLHLENEMRSLTRNDRSVEHKESTQMALAMELLQSAQMDVEQEEHNREDLVKLSQHLYDYQIILWAIEGHQTVPVEVERFNPDGTGFIGLFLHKKHYEFVTHLRGKKPARFCHKCSKWDATKNHYLYCAAKCRRCGSTNCEPGNEKIHCDTCNIDFKTTNCFETHLKPVSGHAHPFCEKYFCCPDCNMIDRTAKFRKSPHICNAPDYCAICRQKSSKDHECRHPLPTPDVKKRKREAQQEWAVVVYDMECIVAESGEFDGHVERGPRHRPNLICVRMFCSKCRGKDGCQKCCQPWSYSYKDHKTDETQKPANIHLVDDSDLDVDSIEDEEEEVVDTPLSNFADFLLRNSRANGAYVIAHNGGRYDHVMLLAELDRQAGKKSQEPVMLMNGMTIISAEYQYEKQKLHFRDSLQYLQMPLAKMPGAFGLEGEAKGFFPHLYNHPDNYDDNGIPTLPAKEYYSPHFMGTAARKEFEEWYETSYNDGFVLHDELMKYCQSDVRILTLTLIAFIELCESIFNGWNPLINGCTLASYVMFVLKHQYIKTDDVGYVPENGYGKENNSALALKYMQWLEKKDPNLKLKYLLRGGEEKIYANGHVYSADGYNEKTKEVYEVHGCLWHGCPKCNPIRDKKIPGSSKMTMQILYDRTIKREEDIRSAGYTLHAKWECEIHEDMDRDPKMKRFFNLCKYDRTLQPREALYGGRTQAFRSITKASKRFSVNYYDFVSMYPYLNAGGTAYPRGNPHRICEDFPSVDEPLTYRGLVFCDVLPAPDGDIGYLPQKIAQKLMFTLCRTCARKQNISGPCKHTKVSERYLTGVWCTDELNKAISKGYKVLKYHEIWHWAPEKWVKGGFFAAYIKPLLKLKHESSGWPRPDMNDDEKKEHVDRILEKDGIALNTEKIKVNKALRSLTKIFLNSAWGKFAQNPIKIETKLINTADATALTNFFNDPRYEPTSMLPYGNKKMFISRKPKRESVNPAAFTNLAIAAITTSAARLRLTEAIERVGVKNMIYCDTDSLIFKQKKGEDPLGDMKGQQLGYLTNEIPEGKKLVEVVAMAPKVYALKMKDKEGNYTYSVKAKGVSLNSGNSSRINFDTMKKAMDEFIKDGVTEPLRGEMLSFKRGENALDGLWTCNLKKRLNPKMDKGHYVDGVVTPFGQLPKGTVLINDYPF